MKTNQDTKQTIPARAFHPGVDIKDELEARGMSQGELAKNLGIERSQLNEIIRGKRNITPHLALLLEKALGIDADYWMNAQKQYELDKARIDENTRKRSEAIEKWQHIKPSIPTKHFRRLRIINDDPVEDIPKLKVLYEVDDTSRIPEMAEEAAADYYRKSEKLEVSPVNLQGWKQLAKYTARGIKPDNPFNKKAKDKLLAELNEILLENSKTKDRIKTSLSKYGIILVYQPHFEKTPVDGISFMIDGTPSIALTLRHKRIDNFAFTLFHELGHIFLHLVEDRTHEEFVDLQDTYKYSADKKEQEANTFASDHLIPSDKWEDFFRTHSRFDDKLITDFADELRIHPAIVFGRICYETGKYKRKTNIERDIK